MEIRKRILKYIESKGISKYKFYQDTGFSNGFLDKKGSVGSDKCEKISYQYPDLSIEWLITGQGYMLRENNSAVTKIHKPTKYTEKSFEIQEIILYDINAAANLKTLLSQKGENVLGVIQLPNIPRCDGAMYVTGDSMEPIIKSGDIICYKEIYDFNNIVYGDMYLISMDIEGDEYLTIKYITRSDKGNEWICLKSHNERHDPKDFELKHINALALVKISIRKHTM
jgi:phage repressor protein C with HTH and peptisase S24 domain